MEKVYSHRNPKNGKMYYLHTRVGKGGGILYYFALDIVGSIPFPAHMEVHINPLTGLPYLKRI